MEREIKFKAYLSSPGSNVNRKRMNFFRTIKSIKEIAYRDSIRSMVTMKHNKRELFGYAINNYHLSTVCDDNE